MKARSPLFSSTSKVGTVVVVLAVSLPFWLIQTQYILSVFTITLIFMTASLGWNIVSGFGGQISFGHSIFFGLGAYSGAIYQAYYGGNAWIGLILGAVAAVVVALLLGWLTLRLRGIFFALATFALTLTFAILAGHYEKFTGGEVGLTLPILGNSPLQFSFENKLIYYYIAVGLAILAFITTWIVLRSRLGLQLRGIRADQDAAQACGVLATRVKLTALAISAILTALAGAVYLQYVRFIDPDSAFGANLATQIAVIAFVGGSGHLWGPVLGASILVPMQQLLNSELSTFPAGFNLVIYGLVVLVILWIEPRGLLALRVPRSWKRKTPYEPTDVNTGAELNPPVDDGLSKSGVDQ